MDRRAASPAVPDQMSVPCARFFAADWEAESFLEFFVDLQSRVATDQAPAGRTVARLQDHARFALQMTVVRSVDSFFAYVADAEQLVAAARGASPLNLLIELGNPSVVSDALMRNERSLAYGNVRQLDRYFAEATSVPLFQHADEIERASRLVVLRNFIAHGRTFAADDLAALVSDATSVGGIGLKLSSVRQDLQALRIWVARIDAALADKWSLTRPVTNEELFDAIARVVRGGGMRQEPYEAATRKLAK
jgi:hypothetical protein